MINNFSGRNTLITGGSSGIGFNIAKMLLKNEIDNVIMVGSNKEKLFNALSRLEEGYYGKVHVLNINLSNVRNSISIHDDNINSFDFDVDILVNMQGLCVMDFF